MCTPIMPADESYESAYDIWQTAALNTSTLNAEATPFMPTKSAAIAFGPLAPVDASSSIPTRCSSHIDVDQSEAVGQNELRRSAWRSCKRQGANGTNGAHQALPPAGRDARRQRRARKTAPAAISKKVESEESHLKKHLDTLQAIPMMRSGLSDLLDSLVVLPVQDEKTLQAC